MIARLLMLVTFIFSFVVIFKTLGGTPAFNPRHVSDTIVGNGRIQPARFMYDLGEYEYQRGYGYIVSKDMSPGYRQRNERQAPLGALLYRAYMAEDAFVAAINVDPANARAWVGLAQAKANLDDFEGAINALRVSWDLAPNSKLLAKRRLRLVGLLTDPKHKFLTLADQDRSFVARDLDVLENFEPRSARNYRTQYPDLAAELDRLALR